MPLCQSIRTPVNHIFNVSNSNFPGAAAGVVKITSNSITTASLDLGICSGVAECELEFPAFHRNVLRRLVPRLLNLYNFFDEQFILFVVFPLAGGLIGLPEGGIWFIYGAAITICLGALKLFNSLHYRKAGRYDEIYQPWAEGKMDMEKENGKCFEYYEQTRGGGD